MVEMVVCITDKACCRMEQETVAMNGTEQHAAGQNRMKQNKTGYEQNRTTCCRTEQHDAEQNSMLQNITTCCRTALCRTEQNNMTQNRT